MTDLAPLRIGVTGSRKYASPAVIRTALVAACRRGRPHLGHVLVHGQCDPFHPGTGHSVRWATAKRMPWEVQGRYLGGDWLAEWAALDMARILEWEIEGHPADWAAGRGAGFARNGGMVKLGADEWLAFGLPCSDSRCRRRGSHATHGTADCAQKAIDAGITLRPYGPGGEDVTLCGSLAIPGPVLVEWPAPGG